MEGGSVDTTMVMAAPLARINVELLDELFGIDLWEAGKFRIVSNGALMSLPRLTWRVNDMAIYVNA